MAFNPDQFLAETEPTQAQGGFDPDKFLSESESKPSIPWSQVPTNAVQDIKGLGEGVLNVGKRLADPMGLYEAASKRSLEPIKEATMEPWNQLKGFASDIGQTVAHPIETFKQHPVGTAMNAAMLAAPVLGRMGKAGAVGKVAETTKAPIEPIVKVPEVAPEVPPKPVAPFEDVISSMKKAVPEAVKKPAEEVAGYLTEKYGDKPLNKGTIGPYIEKNARNMTMKTLGASPGQIRKIGIEKAQKLADYAQEKGIVNYKTGDIGAGQKVDKIHQDSGQVIGDMRGMVAERGAVHDPVKLIQDIHSKIGKEYESGLHSGEQNSYLKALQEVYNTPPTPDAIAKTITKLFQESKNMDRLKQPSGAMADVARELRTKNEAIMSKYLDPTEQKLYHNALEDFGATTQIKEFMKRKESTEMGGRLPPGMGLTRAALQKTLDVVGYRGMAQLQHNVAKWLKSNPKATVTPKELFRKYVDEAVEAIDDIGEGLQ